VAKRRWGRSQLPLGQFSLGEPFDRRWWLVFDNPPIHLTNAQTAVELQEIVTAAKAAGGALRTVLYSIAKPEYFSPPQFQSFPQIRVCERELSCRPPRGET